MSTAISRSQLQASEDPDQKLIDIFGEKFALYRQFFALAEAGQRPTAPLHLDVDVTTACNLRCPMCPAGNTGHIFPGFRPGLFMDRKIYRQALSEAARWQLPSLRLGITGEPLLVPHIDEWVAEAKESGIIDISLITNGQLLTPELSSLLIKAGLTRLMVSVDAASSQTYSKVRPGGDFVILNHNINKFLDLRAQAGSITPLLRLSFVEMSVNMEERDMFEKFYGPLADYLSFQRYQNILGQNDTSFQPDEAKVQQQQGFCTEPYTRLALHVDGGLFPCCSDYGRRRPLGHIEDGGLLATWQSEGALELMNTQTRQPEPCRSCLAEIINFV